MKRKLRRIGAICICLSLLLNSFVFATDGDVINASKEASIEVTTTLNEGVDEKTTSVTNNNSDNKKGNDDKTISPEENEFDDGDKTDIDEPEDDNQDDEIESTNSDESTTKQDGNDESESNNGEGTTGNDEETTNSSEKTTESSEEQSSDIIREEQIENEKHIASSSDVDEAEQTEKTGDDEEEVEEGRVLSFRPSDFKAPKATIDNKSGLFGADPLPSSYDSRNYTNDYGVNIIPSVKDQGNYGTCWAFSEIGMFESAIRKKNYVTNEADGNLSVAALAYFTLNTKNVTNNPEYMDKPGVEGHDYSEVGYSGETFADIGGNYVEANLVASSYIGVVKENTETAYSNMPNIIANGLDGNYAFKRNAYELGSAYFINKSNEDLVKKAIMDYGCVGIAYEEGRNNSNCHQVDGEWYYYHSGVDMNHAVLVVGWNDNIPKEYFYYAPGKYAPRNGGWLVKNSWGTNRPRMNQGYFWISYADPTIDSTIVAIDPIKADTYKYNYHYDTTGNESICYYDRINSRSAKFGNIYKVSENEDQTLDAINIALASTNANYKIEIYTSDTAMANPYDGVKRLSQEDSKVSAGIYTIELNNPVSLKKGTYFSIIVSNMFAHFLHPFDILFLKYLLHL